MRKTTRKMTATQRLKKFFFRNSPPNEASLANPASWLKALFSPRAKSGAIVDKKTVVGISAVWRAINLICESLASMPIDIVRETGDKITIAKNHRVYPLLNVSPHKLYTPFDWMYTKAALTLLTGNGLSYIERDADSRPVSLRIIDPDHYSFDAFIDDNDSLFYKITSIFKSKSLDFANEKFLNKPIPSDDIIHFKWFTLNGISGMSTIDMHQDTFGSGISARDLANYFFKNGAHLGGYIKYPGVLTDDQYDRLVDSWNVAYSGPEKAGKTAILEEGAEYKEYVFDAQKAQMIEAQKFNIEDVARVFGVPPHLLAALERATFNNIEHLSLEFAKYTIRPWATRIEQELRRKLFRIDEQATYRPRFDMSAFMRGDMDSLGDYLQKMVHSGIFSINDARRGLDMNPVSGGDAHFVPLQLGSLQEDGTLKTHESQTQIQSNEE